MNILLTGGTGSFGQEFTKQASEAGHKVTIFSRDELKQSDMQVKFPEAGYRLGDVRDAARVQEVISEGYNVVIHAAALKRVEVGERMPEEVIKTNVLGSLNVVRSCKQTKTPLFALSTDKAVKPFNLYGATKLAMEKAVLAAKGDVIRYGNVAGSRGSVIPTFLKLKCGSDTAEVRDVEATRFLIRLEDAAKFVLNLVQDNWPTGRIHIPRMKSTTVKEVADLILGEDNYNVTTLLPGEKMHEDMTETYSSNDVERFSTEELKTLIEEVRCKLGL